MNYLQFDSRKLLVYTLCFFACVFVHKYQADEVETHIQDDSEAKMTLEKQLSNIDLSPKFKDVLIEADEKNFAYTRENYQKFNLEVGQNGKIVDVAYDTYALSLNEAKTLDEETLKFVPIGNVRLKKYLNNNPNLLFLSIINCNVTDEITDDIIALKKLRVLIIEKTSISEDGMKRLYQKMPSCKINPQQNRFSFPFLLTRWHGDNGLDLFATRPEFDDDDIKKIILLPLRELDIRNSKITNNSIIALESTKTLKSLHANSLELDIESMVSLKGLPNLEEVVFYQTKFKNEALATLLSNKNLKKLLLIQCEFDESEFSSLPDNSKLSCLSIQQSTVTNKVIDHLSKLKQLETIDIALTDIDLEGLLHLVQNCKTIKTIHVLNPQFRKEEVESKIKAVRDDIVIQ